MENDETVYDLVIIGGAAAGCAASVYASRRHLKFIIVTQDFGGEVALSGEVENWPGTIHTTGIELAQQFEKHAKSYEPEIAMGMEVTSITPEGNYHIVTAKNYGGEETKYKTKSVIVGSGIHPRELGVTGEADLKGRGITYCTVCDGPLFGGKTTATIGAGNSAMESALMMAEIAEKVYLITKYPNKEDNQNGFPKAEAILVKKLLEKKNVEMIHNANTTEITGDGAVASLKYTDTETSEEKELVVQGVMVHIGVIPNSKFIDCVEKDGGGQIKVNTKCETNCKGIFAAGDVTDIPYNQIAIAAGQGVTAALSAIEYLNLWKEE